MILPYTLSADYDQHVDELLQDTSLSDNTFYSRAQHWYLDVFDETNSVLMKSRPPWAERIHNACRRLPSFTTPDFFNVMYQVTDELGLVAGSRYVSAAICVCCESVARVGDQNSNPEQSAADVAHALHELSSTQVAFLLWPFYAHSNEYRERERDLRPASGDETPTAESIAREHRRHWKEQVMARDDYRCFMSGALDSRAYYPGRAIPEGARVVYCYTVPIISPEVGTQRTHEGHKCQPDQCLANQEITLRILTRCCGIDTATLLEKTQDGPHNSLFVQAPSESAFRQLLWCLHPTETPDRYEIRSYIPPVDTGCRHVTTHVAFVDHSSSAAPGIAQSGVDLPDRELLRAHAALAGVLHRSAVHDMFGFLRRYLPWFYRDAGSAVYPVSTGAAFWRSLIEYPGPDVSLDVQVWCDSDSDSDLEPELERKSGLASARGEGRGCAVSS